MQFVPISALKGDGIDKLLEAIILQGEILDLKAVFEVVPDVSFFLEFIKIALINTDHGG